MIREEIGLPWLAHVEIPQIRATIFRTVPITPVKWRAQTGDLGHALSTLSRPVRVTR
jgi:hypothetical protein